MATEEPSGSDPRSDGAKELGRAESTVTQGRDGAGIRKRVTIKDVANEAGVSSSTVSHVLTGNRPISEPTVNRVYEAIRRLRYVPNHWARSLAMEQSSTVCLMLPYDQDTTFIQPFFLKLIGSLSATALSRGYAVSVLPERGISGFAELEKIIAERRVDGVVLMSSGASSSVTELLTLNEMPFVFIGKPDLPGDQFYYVDNDNEQIGFDAVQFFVRDRDAARIGVICGDTGFDPFAGFMSGVERAVEHFSDRVQSWSRQVGRTDEATGFSGTARILEELGAPIDIFAFTDLLAAGVVHATRSLGLRIPEDVRLICAGNSELTRLMMPPVTSFVLHVKRMGSVAADMLISLIEGRQPMEREVVLQSDILERESTQIKKRAQDDR